MSRNILFVFMLAILLAGCASAPAQDTTEITVEASDFAYQPATITIPVDQPVTITLNNAGKVEHDFVVEKINVTDVQASDGGPAATIWEDMTQIMTCTFSLEPVTRRLCNSRLWSQEPMRSFAPSKDIKKQAWLQS